MSVEESHAVMEKVMEIVSGQPAFDIMAIFSWILGSVIVQTKADPEAVFSDFRVMVGSAIEMLNRAPKGSTIN